MSDSSAKQEKKVTIGPIEAKESSFLVPKIAQDAGNQAVLLERESKWRFWHPASPTHRFFLLVLICLIPFGGHFVKNGFSALEQLILDDPDFPVSNTMYGALVSAISIPNMLIPLIGGNMLDKYGDRSIIFFLVWTTLGQMFFTIAMEMHSFWFALFGRLFFGIGEGSVIVASRVLIAVWFQEEELTFAMGTSVAITNVAKMLAKASMAPVALYFGGYDYALWYSTIICVICVFIGVAVGYFTKRMKSFIAYHKESGMTTDMPWLENCTNARPSKKIKKMKKMHQEFADLSKVSLKEFSCLFWLVVILHVVFVNTFHLFQNISSSYFYQMRGLSLVDAGYVSSLSHTFVIFAPVLGLFVDCFGGSLIIILGSSFLSIIAYLILMYSSVSPIVPMILFSLCLCLTPTIQMASIPLTVSSKRLGLAFGISEVLEAIGSTSGNLVVGVIRDNTGDYSAVVYFLFGMAIASFLLSVALTYEDYRQGWPIRNKNCQKKRRAISYDDQSSAADVQLSFLPSGESSSSSDDHESSRV